MITDKLKLELPNMNYKQGQEHLKSLAAELGLELVQSPTRYEKTERDWYTSDNFYIKDADWRIYCKIIFLSPAGSVAGEPQHCPEFCFGQWLVSGPVSYSQEFK